MTLVLAFIISFLALKLSALHAANWEQTAERESWKQESSQLTFLQGTFQWPPPIFKAVFSNNAVIRVGYYDAWKRLLTAQGVWTGHPGPILAQ